MATLSPHPRASTTRVDRGGNSPSGLNGSVKFLRISCWVVALAMGAASAWTARFTMYPDGVSYLDVGDAFWRGDWHNAINSYWSPLYPIILGFFMKVFRPSIAWEYPLVHVVNFLMYVLALVCFEFFFSRFLRQQQTNQEPNGPTEIGLPTWAWLLAGYSAFTISSLFLITISFVSGDMIVAATIYLASGLILRIRGGSATWRIFALLGVVLGIGYLAKAVMFLMSIPFIAVAVATQKGRTEKLRFATIALGFFLLVAGPLVMVLSIAKGRPTFGDSGKINYLMNVGTTQFFTPHEPTARHPVHKLAALPNAYEYASPIGGTYPLWLDPSYWHEGIQPQISLTRQIRRLLLAIAECAWISISPFMGLGITVAIAFLYLVGPSIGRCLRAARAHWVLWIPALAGIGLYSLVVVEARYVAALFCLLWLVALSGVRLPASIPSRRIIATVAVGLAVVTFFMGVWQIYRAHDGSIFAKDDVGTPECAKVAEALTAHGIKPGDKIAVISSWLFPSRQGAYIARLARVRIIADARSDEYWAADPATRVELMKEFTQSGATAVLTYKPTGMPEGWLRMADTDYFLYVVSAANPSDTADQ